MAKSANVQDVFMLFGDSITQGGWEPTLDGFGQKLSHVYARRLDVLNRGYSGYNTEWGLPVFEQCVTRSSDKDGPKIRALTIWFGANDACLEQSPQHVPLPKFKSNLKRMVSLVNSPTSPHPSPTTRIILISAPPVDELARQADLASRNPPVELDRKFDVTRTYAAAVGDVAKEEGVAFVDVWTKIWEAADEKHEKLKKFLGDGLHLNGEGYKIMYDELIRVISKEYPEIHYDNLPFVFPPWASIDFKDPSKSLYTQKA